MTGPLKSVGRLGPVVFVECGPEAHAFVVDAWCKSYEPVALEHLGMGTPEQQSKDVRRAVCSGIYTKVKGILARPETRILCGVSEHDESVVCGFAVHTRTALHYVYVKSDMRRLGLASALRQCAVAGVSIVDYTHHTPAGANLVFHLRYRPEEATHG